MKNWAEPKSVQDIQVFIGFANFYQRFIKSFSTVAGWLTSILKTTTSCKKLVFKAFGADSNKVVGVVSSKTDRTVKNYLL